LPNSCGFSNHVVDVTVPTATVVMVAVAMAAGILVLTTKQKPHRNSTLRRTGCSWCGKAKIILELML